MDTQVFSFDDVPKNFSFGKIFSVITEGMSIQKKHKTTIKLKYSDSPKIVITTNYVIKGRGFSHNRRKFELEFGEYYGIKLSPYEDFNKELFNNWDVEHFNRFDNYMVGLIQRYMNTGLIVSVSDTAGERKLAAQTDPLFVGWMEDIVDSLNTIQPYLELYNACLQESGLGKVPFKDFSIWVNDYCEYHGYDIHTKRIHNKLNIQIINRKKPIEKKEKDDTPF